MQILFLSGWYPYPPDNGSRIRIYRLIKALAQHHQVTLATFGDDVSRAQVEALSRICRVEAIVPTPQYNARGRRALLGFASAKPRSLVATFSVEMSRVVQDQIRANRYDVIVASQINTASYVPRDCAVSAILEELETSVIRDASIRRSEYASRMRASLTWLKLRRYLRTLLRRFAACTVVSELERVNLKGLVPDQCRVDVVPNGYDSSDRCDGTEVDPNLLVFNGSLTYSANFDAMAYFVQEIWSRIRREEPTCRLKITGKTNNGQGELFSNYGGVCLTGYLEDIRPAVASATACVVPLRIGGGTRLKILEAMALGTPVVSTGKGAEGLEVTPEEDILIADEPGEFAAQTVRLLRDPALRARLAENGRRLVEQKYDWRVIGERFNRLVESVADVRKAA